MNRGNPHLKGEPASQVEYESEEKYLLYIDILGFSHLVRHEPQRALEVYSLLDSLNAHKHHAFKSIVFSDTVLVYNKYPPRSIEDHRYLVMFACEFAQDLVYNFMGRGLSFRGLLTVGTFEHRLGKNLQAFYGESLVRAYEWEKSIPSVGLFMDHKCARYSHVFPTAGFDERVRFVFLLQHLSHLASHGLAPPLPRTLFEAESGYESLYYLAARDVKILEEIHSGQRHADSHVRTKFMWAWRFYRERYPLILDHLERHSFDLKCLCPEIDWSAAKQHVASYNQGSENTEWRRPD